MEKTRNSAKDRMSINSDITEDDSIQYLDSLILKAKEQQVKSEKMKSINCDRKVVRYRLKEKLPQRYQTIPNPKPEDTDYDEKSTKLPQKKIVFSFGAS